MTKEEDVIGVLIDDFHAAVRDKDAHKAKACFADDALIFDLAPPLQSQPYRTQHNLELESWFATWRGPIVVEDRGLVIEAANDVAYSRSLQHLTGTKADGVEIDLWYRATMGFRRIDDRWQIAHLHESVPFAMDGSGQALLDLRP
jgi:ketosteroid isomerase-like protein